MNNSLKRGHHPFRRASRPLLAAAAAVALLALPVKATAGQILCADHDDLLARVKAAWGETPVAAGVTVRGQLMQLVVSDAGSWSVITTTPEGPSCLVMTGEGLRIEPKAAPKGEPS